MARSDLPARRVVGWCPQGALVEMAALVAITVVLAGIAIAPISLAGASAARSPAHHPHRHAGGPSLVATATFLARVPTATVTVSGVGNVPSILYWNVHGPLAPNPSGPNPCAGKVWGVDSTRNQNKSIPGNGTYQLTTTGPMASAGCYAFTITLTAGNSIKISLDPTQKGSAAPVALLSIDPTLTDPTFDAVGSEVHTSVTVEGTKGATGELIPFLYGPLTSSSGTCEGLNWATAINRTDPRAASVTADGTVSLPVVDTAAWGPGCYEMRLELLSANYLPHQPPLTVGQFPIGLVEPTPLLSVQTKYDATSETAQATFQVIGSVDTTSSLHWSLLGPVAPGSSGGCTTVS